MRIKSTGGNIAGSGRIEANGGSLTQPGGCSAWAGGGGGGRVALETAGFSGFDPLAQVKVWAGVTDCTGTVNDRFAAAGTLYYRTAGAELRQPGARSRRRVQRRGPGGAR